MAFANGTQTVEAQLERLQQVAETSWTLTIAVIIFFMQCGFAMLEAGTVREQSVRAVLLKNLLDACVGSLAWYLLGYILASDSGGPFIGVPDLQDANVVTPFDLIQVGHGSDMGKYLMSFMYAVTSATIVSGACAERTQQRAYSMQYFGIILSLAAFVAMQWPHV